MFSDGKLALLEIGNEVDVTPDKKESSSDSPSSSETSSNGFSCSDSSSSSDSSDGEPNLQKDFAKATQNSAAEAMKAVLGNTPKADPAAQAAAAQPGATPGAAPGAAPKMA